MTPPRLAVLAALALTACGGDRSHSMVCGLSQLAGPMLIQQRLGNPRYVLTDPPRGLPNALPARVAQKSQGDSRVLVGYSDQRAAGQLVLSYQGGDFPVPSVNDTMSYAVLVVDDTSQRAMGILVYETRRPPAEYPRVGIMEGGSVTIPVYGVRVEWSGVSNPRCPLLGAPPASPSAPTRP
jgi:hypothetical protein